MYSRKLNERMKSMNLNERKSTMINLEKNGRKNWSEDGAGGIEKLPEDVLMKIVSLLSVKESARTSVVARGWRYLWKLAPHKTLEFDCNCRDMDKDGKTMDYKEFTSWVDTVLNLKRLVIEGLIISFNVPPADLYKLGHPESRAVDKWVYTAMQKQVETFSLDLSSQSTTSYVFPSLERLTSHHHHHPFQPLRSLTLVNVRIGEEMVGYFLECCPDLEELCIRLPCDQVKANLRLHRPPRLRVLDISGWETLEVSAVNLVSLTYQGRNKSLVLNNIPNLRQLTLGGEFAFFFLTQPNQQHDSTYSIHLDKLVLDLRSLQNCNIHEPVHVGSSDLPRLWSLKRLEVRVFTIPGQSLCFFISLINAAKHLCEFRIELSYPAYPASLNEGMSIFPDIKDANAKGSSVKYEGRGRGRGSRSRKLKMVEVVGYRGCWNEEKLLLSLFKMCPSIERVFIDTEADYNNQNPRELRLYISFLRRGSSSSPISGRDESRRRAKRLLSKFPPHLQWVIT